MERTIEYIVDKRVANGKGNKNEYLVRYVGLDDSQNQWINEQDLDDSDLIDEFNTPRCVYIKKIMSACKNKNNRIFYHVVLSNGLIESYPSSFLRKHHPEMLQRFLEKCYMYDKTYKIQPLNEKKEKIDISDLIAF